MKGGMFVFGFLIALLPVSVHAQVLISEVMYDVSNELGSDDKREWIEIHNTGNESVDLTGWKVNDGSNHVLNEPPKNGGRGTLTIGAGEYVILADDATTFLGTFNVLGEVPVIDTVLSLNNTGETITLVNADGQTIDTFSYTKEDGAAGDGNSLHRNGTTLTPGTPSPGSSDVSAPIIESSESTESGSTNANATNQSASNSSSTNNEVSLRADAGENRVVIVGAETVLKGQAFGKNNVSLSNTRFLWNFGDGAIGEGKTVTHTWMHPGKYAVILDVGYDKQSASHKIIVEAVPAEVSVVTEGNDIVVKNLSARELDVSGWLLRSGGFTAGIPVNTIILPREQIRFASEVTNLNVSADVALLYPNGTVATELSFESEPIVEEVVEAPTAPPPPTPAPQPPPQIAQEPIEAHDVELEGEEEEPQSFEKETSSVATSTQVASAATAISGLSLMPSSPWMIGLLALVGTAGLGVAAARAARAREWEVVEVND